jgi:acyl-CoA reductase-like NAD-dependent aldehyde dehydrogenase
MIMERAAPTLKRLTLELGGNDAALVLPDVDPVEIAPKLFEAAFNYSGQACIAIKRLYVHDDIYDAMCDELATIASSMRVGIDLGPLQNRRQYERVLGLLEDARSHGTIIAGGSASDRPGYFVEPTIVRDIDEGTRIVDEEQFGPILPVLRFSDPDEALQRINASPMGLGGSVWSADLEEARRLALQMHAGTVWINKHVDLDPMIPLGGAKRSGIGVELGLVGLEEYTQRVVISAAT